MWCVKSWGASCSFCQQQANPEGHCGTVEGDGGEVDVACMVVGQLDTKGLLGSALSLAL